VAKLQRACLTDPVKVEVDSKYQTVDTLRQQYLFIPAKFKVTLQISQPFAPSDSPPSVAMPDGGHLKSAVPLQPPPNSQNR